MKAVAIVTNSLSGGGAERAMNLLANNLSNLPELDVLLIPINAGPRDLVEPNCEISEIGRIWNGGLWETVKAFARFQYSILKFKPNFLILNCDLPEFYAAFAIWNAKCIIVEHTTRPWVEREFFGNLVRIILRLRGTAYVRVSERIEPSPLFKDDAIIPNIVDPEIIGSKSRQSEVSEREGRLVFIGRLSKEKRPDLFIELVRKTGLKAVIIGDGQLRSSLEQSSQSVLHLEFLGQQLNPWDLATDRDLVVLTSDYEGDGLVALEAISIGIPVVLRSTADLLRIGFPDRNYFPDIPTLAVSILNSDFEEFRLNDLERLGILKNRNPEVVSRLWLKLLFSLD